MRAAAANIATLSPVAFAFSSPVALLTPKMSPPPPLASVVYDLSTKPRRFPPPQRSGTASTASLSSFSSQLSSSAADDVSVVSSKPERQTVDKGDTITILGLGSLLSERSSRLTFPNLTNFRLGRVPNHRRVFCHPAAIFFERGIANMDTLEISSLSSEYCEGESFVCSVFDVPADEVLDDPAGDGGDRGGGLVPSMAYLEREEEFDIVAVDYEEKDSSDAQRAIVGTGILCRRSTDAAYAARWGDDRFAEKYGKHGITTIWGWDTESGIKPCGPYLRHCVLAAEKMGQLCFDSFLDETYLADRTTTIRDYLEFRPDVMTSVPPGDLAVRYGG